MADDTASIVAALRGNQPAADDPFAAAAARVRGAVMPEGGRQEGRLTQAAETMVPNTLEHMAHILEHMAHIPERAFQASDAFRNGYGYDPAPIVDAAMLPMGIAAPYAEAGAAGIFGGKLAKTANMKALEMAEKMHERQMPIGQVRDATGWFKDPVDLQWKFEIPDNSASVMNFPRTQGYVKGPAEALFNHPELYRAYPQLKSTTMELANDSRKSGLFDPNIAKIEVAAPTAGEAGSVGVHEMQHAVQNLEKFGSGSEPSWYARQIEQELRGKNNPFNYNEIHELANGAYRRTSGEVEARNAQARQRFTPDERKLKHPWDTQEYPYNEQLLVDPITNMVHTLRNRR